MSNSKQCLWVFGNAVQDITVDVDMERLSHGLTGKNDVKMRLSDKGLEIKSGLSFEVQSGLKNFEINMQLDDEDEKKIKKNRADWPIFKGGVKYTLKNPIPISKVGKKGEVPCGTLSWGGGGANVVTFLRALAPNDTALPIKYSDIAMSRPLPDLVKKFKEIIDPLENSINRLYDTDPAEAEKTTDKIARLAAQYSPECSLEVYLASLHVKSVLYRPKKPEFRRNLVFSRSRSASQEIHDKIIFRGGSNLEIKDDDKVRISKLLISHENNVGAILLNSIKDEILFQEAYSLYQRVYHRGVVGILAMTKAMRGFTSWMLQNCDKKGKLPPFILVFNQEEAYQFANKLDEKFGTPKDGDGKFKIPENGDELPDIRKFAELAIFLRSKFSSEHPPRIYITLGPNGSLGVENSGHVIYVSSFSKSGAKIYDTNACGDAYCAAIALLEWAKHQGHKNIAKIDFHSSLAPYAQEMEYFMAVATAAAYCKATNRRGRVYVADVKDLLQNHHLASQILPSIYELEEEQARELPECVDENFRLKEPSLARFPGVTEALSALLG